MSILSRSAATSRKFLIGMVLLSAGAPAGAGELEMLRTTVMIDQGRGSGYDFLFDGGTAGRRAAGGAGAVAASAGARAGTLEPSGDSPYSLPLEASVPVPFEEGRRPPRETGAWAGIKRGGEQGALGGFYSVLSPAIKLVEEGFDRDMSRRYDGARSDNGGSGLFWAGGIVLAVILYIPALIAGGIAAVGGAVAGAAAETAAPGSTKGWDVEKKIFG